MREMIAYCGLDCEKCEARIATVTHDEKLRAEVARKWSEWNRVEITPDMIYCEGCRVDGLKTPFCDKLCPIRQCALNEKVETCGQCGNLRSCEKVGKIIENNKDALARLENK